MLPEFVERYGDRSSIRDENARSVTDPILSIPTEAGNRKPVKHNTASGRNTIQHPRYVFYQDGLEAHRRQITFYS